MKYQKLQLSSSEEFSGKTHQEMLLEMCNSLLGDCIWNDSLDSVRFDYDDRTEDICWLEVCLVQLPKALSTPNNRSHDIAIRQSCHLHGFFHHSKHIIDYLYKEYQDKCVLNKNK